MVAERGNAARLSGIEGELRKLGERMVGVESQHQFTNRYLEENRTNVGDTVGGLRAQLGKLEGQIAGNITATEARLSAQVTNVEDRFNKSLEEKSEHLSDTIEEKCQNIRVAQTKSEEAVGKIESRVQKIEIRMYMVMGAVAAADWLLRYVFSK